MDHAPAGRARLILLGAVAPVVWGTTYVVTTELLPPGVLNVVNGFGL